MPFTESEVELLSNFGLTGNQAKVYMTIVRLGLTTVGQIAKVSKVRREDVYRVLPKLEKCGLIERVLGAPIQIRATPVEEALSILIKREQESAKRKVSELMLQKDVLLKEFKERARTKLTSEQRPQFALLQGDLIANKIITMIKTANKEIDIMVPRESAIRFAQSYQEQLQKAAKGNVRIRILSEIPEYEDSLLRMVQSYTSRTAVPGLKCLDDIPCQCLIVDFKQMLIATSKEALWERNNSLWTDNKDLVGIMQRNFEDMWHNAVSIRTIETTGVSEKVSHFISELRPTSHAIFVYESSEAKRNILFTYLKVGLENGEAAAYVAAEEPPSQIREAMNRFGIDVEKFEKAGALRVYQYTEVYIVDGKFNALRTIGLWNKMFNEALTKGFRGLRVTGEMSCFFKHGMVQELLEYEKALHRILDVPMIAVCAYNSKLLNQTRDPVNLYTELVRAHGTVLFTGIDNKFGRIQIRTA